MSEICQELHELGVLCKRHIFLYDNELIPSNGIYLLYESGESGHGSDRIVRVGTHTGLNKLPSRIKEHFLTQNKDRSIFRKNIGRALLCRNKDPFLDMWNFDRTSRRSRV